MKLRDVLVSEMRPGANIRQDPQEDGLRALGQSLLRGQEQPVILFEDLTIYEGWRRWLAAQRVGITTLKALVCERPPTRMDVVTGQWMMNFHRAGLSGWEQYQAARTLLELNPTWRARDLAEHLKVDASTVCRISSPDKTIVEVREALQAGQINLSQVYKISQVPEVEQAALLESALNGKGREALARQRRRPASEVVRMGRIRCDLPSGVGLTLSGEALSLDDVVESLGEAHKAAKKALAEGLDAKTWQRVMSDKAKAGGSHAPG